MKPTPPFIGRGWKFPPDFRLDGTVGMVEGLAEIEESLDVLLRTRIGERLMHPEYGAELHAFVFEGANLSTRTTIGEVVRDAILYFEPRIEVLRLSVEPSPLEGRLDIEVQYRVAGTNTRNNYVLPFYLREATGAP